MIRVALIGSGIFARETYITNIQSNCTRVQLTAILSRTPESIESALKPLSSAGLASAVERFSGVDGEEKFFERAREICDGVIIVVPIPLLGRYIERCLAAGLHVLSEKPIAMTSTEARRLIKLYRDPASPAIASSGGDSRQNLWHVAENYRLEPAILYARDLVREHKTSPKSFSLLALRQQAVDSKYAVTAWRTKPEYNGSFVLDGGIHFVALLRTILEGEVSDIRSIYDEKSFVEVGACGACRVGSAGGTFNIKYGAFLSVVCRLDIYWDDAIMSVIQHKGVGYEVAMTGRETKTFPFQGVQEEFKLWLDTFGANRSALETLSPEEGLLDLLVVEQMCNTKL